MSGRMVKIHIVRPGQYRTTLDRRKTFCGREGWPASNASSELETAVGEIIEVGEPRRATCLLCRRAHSLQSALTQAQGK